MSADTVIYGHSRGYRVLAVFAFGACAISLSAAFKNPGVNIVALVGAVAFGILTWYAWRRSTLRTDILHITDDGFLLTDPAQTLGLIRYDEIEELRIHALHSHPIVGYRLLEPDHIRRRGPAIMRVIVKPIWRLRHDQVVVELDGLNDQVAAIKSVAVRTGIPVRSELL
jgi:hypothetical protein